MTEERATRPAYRGPLYAQVAQVIRSEIANGRWRVGTILPSELDMAQSYDVSVGTMRKALAMLTDDKMIRRSRGRGTEIIASQPQARLSVLDYGTEIPPTDDIDVKEEAATQKIADKLCVPRGQHVTVIVRRIVFDDKSRAVECLYLPKAIYEEVRHVNIFSSEKLEDAYQGMDPMQRLRAEEWISTDISNNEIASILRIPEGTQVLKVARLLSLGDDPVEYSERYLNLDGVAYALQRRTPD